METIRDQLLELWFGTKDDDAEVGESQSSLWWGSSAETDDLLGARFGQAAAAAAAGTLDHWSGSPRGRLALLLLLDQLPRVIYRGAPGAFAQDARARRVADKGLASGADRLLRPIERVFFYLPFEHSEDPVDQQRSVGLFPELAAEVPEEWTRLFDSLSRLRRPAQGDHRSIRPFSAPQRHPWSRVDGGGDRVPRATGIGVLACPRLTPR